MNDLLSLVTASLCQAVVLHCVKHFIMAGSILNSGLRVPRTFATSRPEADAQLLIPAPSHR
ncbi:hypothetical protein BC938DRAFT_476810 [Jimgerdemannia flammicorona]|uniref:Uncharacterized protein n=1 Tax=Jimgerdemannia flammicorona TaxID=994334 RepID=A0A433QQ64_9FUNG|nr:hypothetical protein BC938DRAFT_476810 [Jimgerdemannia flammicorona]